MAKAIRYHKQGGPEVLQLDDIPVGEPAQGQVRIRHTAIGVNFVDTYQRSGLYPMQVPAVAGNEGAGIVDAVGPGVKDLKKGDRVAYTGLPGSYCELRVVPADRMVKIPKGISDEQAASMMLKGMTVHYLIHSTYKVKKGDMVLWHAAAGGVGLIAGQWLKKLGAVAIGTVSSEEKAKLAKAHGYKHVINYSTENFVEKVKEITKGRKLPVVYDAVGKTTWDGSLDCLQPRGLMASFGNASGPVPPQNLGILASKGSLYVTRPTLATYIASRAEPGDASPEFTALRETREEIGLAPERVEVIARMPEYLTRTGYRVTPVVGLIAPPLELAPDSREVAEAFEVPLAFLLDPAHHQRETRELGGRTVGFWVMQYGERRIWGATAGMLVNLYRMLA
jgi:NADPH2:quinone reductase